MVAIELVERELISADGTSIGWRELGQGPPLIIVHGSMQSADSHRELATALADHFTVLLPDRRGRARSGPYTDRPVLEQELDDLEALIQRTGADRIFGVSSGGLIALEAARRWPTLRQVAVFEPPLVIEDSADLSFIDRFRRELAEGRLVAAAVTGMLGAQMGPPGLARFPRPLLQAMSAAMFAVAERRANGAAPTMRSLIPTLGFDFAIVEQARDSVQRYVEMTADLLLLGGDRSPAYLQTAVAGLATAFPAADRVILPGVGHEATGNRDQRGRPELVAGALRQFFSTGVAE